MSQPVTPHPTEAPAPRRSWFARHKILTTIGAVVIVVVVVGALGGGGGSTPDAGAPTVSGTGDAVAPAAEEPAPEEPVDAPAPDGAGIGTPVRDGKLEFTVTAVEPGGTRVGDDMLGQDAQGQFLLVRMTVVNIGDEAQYFDGSSQKLVDTQGRTHSADGSAAIYLGDAESFLNQINPGNTVQGTVVFDVPVDAAPASLELHDSMFSGGVTVVLG